MALIQGELLLFAGVFFLIGALDDFAVDLCWIWLRLTGKAKTRSVDRKEWVNAPLSGEAAVFIPTWNESAVIGDTIGHTLAAWPQSQFRLYVGCYKNDPATIEAAMQAADGDPRLRLVIHDRTGPSTKADCLNRLYRAMQADETRYGHRVRMIVFHDAEDMVDPAALSLLDREIDNADFVQLPVLPTPQRKSRFLGSHYCEEFAEAHGKAMVVRDALNAALPGAGVGCAIARDALSGLADANEGDGPFNAGSLTEDYELGLELAEMGSTHSFLRCRHAEGDLVATRAYFPTRLDHIVKQKTRWVHGIALQGWDRLGWGSSGANRIFEVWMRLRDRRGPLAAFVLFTGYLLLALAAFGWGASLLGFGSALTLTPFVKGLLLANLVAFIWRSIMRFAFTAREYGMAEGIWAIMRIPVSNIIAIMAGRRAIWAYAKTLSGADVVWDKTPHNAHPARTQRTARTQRLAGSKRLAGTT